MANIESRNCPLTGKLCTDPRCGDPCWGEGLISLINNNLNRSSFLDRPEIIQSLLADVDAKLIEAIWKAVYPPEIHNKTPDPFAKFDPDAAENNLTAREQRGDQAADNFIKKLFN